MVDAEEVVEDVGVAPVVVLHLPELTGLPVDDGLDPAGDTDEGPLRGVTHGLLVVDDVEDLEDECPLRLGEVAVGRVGVDDVAHHLLRGVAGAQPADGRGQEFLAEPFGLLVVGGDPVFQGRDAPFVLGPLDAHRPASAVQYDGERGDHGGGDRAAHDDCRPRGAGDRHRAGRGGARHQHDGQERGTDYGDVSFGRR